MGSAAYVNIGCISAASHMDNENISVHSESVADTEVDNDSAASFVNNKNLNAWYRSLKTSWDDDENSSVLPIISAVSGYQSVNILLDNCNEITLIASHLVENLKLKTFEGQKMSVTGLGDVTSSRSSTHTTIPVSFKAEN